MNLKFDIVDSNVTYIPIFFLLQRSHLYNIYKFNEDIRIFRILLM